MAERLGLVAARDHAAVLARQHDDRAAAQLRLDFPPSLTLTDHDGQSASKAPP